MGIERRLPDFSIWYMNGWGVLAAAESVAYGAAGDFGVVGGVGNGVVGIVETLAPEFEFLGWYPGGGMPYSASLLGWF